VALATNAAAALSEASPADAGRAYALLAGVFRDLGEPDRARELYELAAEKLEPGPERYRTEVYGALADIFEAEGDHAAALGALRRALAMRSTERRAAGDPPRV
jgi:tetratricopeptide (TPR) repeat protein